MMDSSDGFEKIIFFDSWKIHVSCFKYFALYKLIYIFQQYYKLHIEH